MSKLAPHRALALLAFILLLLVPSTLWAWRSQLYPTHWKPGYTDGQGRFLHDFSYAGYHGGADGPPSDVPGPTVDVTKPPYGADPTGATNATNAIQQAIDDVGAGGGGVIFLPAGTYRVAPQGNAPYALHIGDSGVVLRGAGAGTTFLLNDASDMRHERVIVARPDAAAPTSWYGTPTDARPLTQDASAGGQSVKIDDSSGYAAGDWIVVRSDPTDDFIADHDMTGEWNPTYIGGPIFYRRIVSVDSTNQVLELDTPLRYDLLTRDAARINRIVPHIEEIGVESLSIGMRQSDKGGLEDDDYQNAGTAGYDAHNSFAIYYNHVVDGWIRDVSSYRPSGNADEVHLLSNGIRMDAARFITVEDVDLQRPQYRGEGGNGYLVVLSGQECLVQRATTSHGRHNFSFGLMQSSGNVIHDSSASHGRLPVDFHMHLSMANLVDNLTLDDDFLEARHRQCCGHGHGTTQSVFWNIEGLSYPSDQIFVQFIVHSVQFGHGYVIGTRGPADGVQTLDLDDPAPPTDHVEGEGQGATLEPASVWLDQRARRLGEGGEGGSRASGGAGGEGGISARGGAASHTGAGGASGGASPSGGASSDTKEPNPAGCGCRASGEPSQRGWWAALLVLGMTRQRRRLRR